jgi:hypothetical protein
MISGDKKGIATGWSEGCKYPRAPNFGRCVKCGWTYIEQLDRAIEGLEKLRQERERSFSSFDKGKKRNPLWARGKIDWGKLR